MLYTNRKTDSITAECLNGQYVLYITQAVVSLLFQACIINKAKCQGEDAWLPCNICDGQSLCCRGKIRCSGSQGKTLTNHCFITSLQLQAKC